MTDKAHKSAFISLVGKPNVGKSTLMNALVGENLSIITSKAQTTRHRIQGIISGDDFQIVYSNEKYIFNTFTPIQTKTTPQEFCIIIVISLLYRYEIKSKL